MQQKDYIKKTNDKLCYYQHMNWFPLCSLLTENESELCKREFAVTTTKGYYKRYLSFANAKDLSIYLCNNIPDKLHIGPVHDGKILKQKTANMQPTGREFIIDIDMDSYDDVRVCCQGNQICKKCWVYIKCAFYVFKYIFEKEFKVSILLVFSGGRGAHFWVSNPIFFQFSGTQRLNVFKYINLFQGKKINLFPRKLLQTYQERYNICKVYAPYLINWYKHQELICSMIESQSLKGLFGKFMTQLTANAVQNFEKWEAMFDNYANFSSYKTHILLNKFRIVFHFTYPRMDGPVSTVVNHLIKAPFSIHPRTNNICLPLSIQMMEQFDPRNTLTVSDFVICISVSQRHRKYKWKDIAQLYHSVQFLNEYLSKN